jgi:hypothetical protein
MWIVDPFVRAGMRDPTSLELCDIDKDLKEFIDKNKTGSERPGMS